MTLASPLETATKVKVLLVDDRPEELLAMEAVLSGLDAELHTARSGRDALRTLLKHEFAVIVLDVNMPDMNGFETAALIRKRSSSEHTSTSKLNATSSSSCRSTNWRSAISRARSGS
jgi:CheY-like chemotaxis protein